MGLWLLLTRLTLGVEGDMAMRIMKSARLH